jgi:diguanylate cyclase (GGDEF)-like protein
LIRRVAQVNGRTADWQLVLATQQLTEFLSVVADRPGGPAAQQAAVECAARALDAEIAVLMIDEGVAAAYGIAPADVPTYAIGEVVAGRRTSLEVGDRPHAATVAPIGGDPAGHLVLGRTGAPFTAEEICLLHGLARVLELSLRTLQTTESEQRYARENNRLLDTLHQRQRLFEQLTDVQRAIARRAPQDEILGAVTSDVRALLDVDMCTLNLLDRADRTRAGIAASSGVPAETVARLQHLPLHSGGVSGLAILGDELVMVADYDHSPIALPSMSAHQLQSVMATPVHENGVVVGSLTVGTYRRTREWDKSDQEVIEAYAEHVSLALTDARTLEAMNQAFHDSLTGLASRALFLTRMEESLAAGSLAVLFVDLDRFKVVNDSLGHAAGDRLLVEVADRIRACLRDQDTAARLGGDEFAVLLPGIGGVDEATPIADRILVSLREPFQLGAGESYISSSIGVAFSRGGVEHTAQELMVHADLAMYQAKKQGKDRVEVFRPEMREAFQATIALEADLRRAVLRHEFELRYQPIVHLRTNEIIGVEALIRWRHPELGVVAPLDFIPLAEETGMIVPIGEWVLREACTRVAEWNQRAGRPLSVSVNISAVQLDQSNLPQLVQAVLEECGLPPHSLVLELTESLMVDHRPETLRRLEAIKALGVRLAIDDFGTGYSSLAYLRQFPVDIIKIDKSFVDDVVDEPTAAALTHGIIQLGQALNLSTVAEGIEHAGQLSSLAGGNCELGQGYYFAEPLTGADLSDLLFPHDPA